MDAVDRRVRKFVFDRFLESTCAPSAEEVALGCGLGRAAAVASMQRLDAAHHLKLLEGTERILMAFPFSAVATPYRVTRTNGRRYFANCAWDAVAFHPMLREPVTVDSFCRHCGNPIRFSVGEGGEPGASTDRPLVFLSMRAADWWVDIVRTCSNTMVFLESADHLEAWRAAESPPGGTALSVEQTVRLSEPIYSGKMALGYDRPTQDSLQTHFAKLGLTGEFWKL